MKRIRHTVEALSSPFFDRPAVERIFGVKARQANNIMRGMGSYQIGGAAVVNREDLLAWLDLMASSEQCSVECERKTRVVVKLDAFLAARPRRVTHPPPRKPNSVLPTGIRLAAPGELLISFTSADDLLGRIMGLAQSATGNFAAFANEIEVEPPPEPNPE
jgi:hypothetical protein